MNDSKVPVLARAEFDRLTAEAISTPCDYAGCDGGWHEPRRAPVDWSHVVFEDDFDCVNCTIIADPENTPLYSARISLDATGTMGTQELRAEAARYAGYPVWLLSIADRVDALNSSTVVR